MRHTDCIPLIRAKYEALAGLMTELVRRRWAAAEALALGYGGITAVSCATGLAHNTIAAGIAELRGPSQADDGRIRRVGAGRKPVTTTDPGLLDALDRLIDPVTRGDPMSPLRWTCKSTRNLANELTRQGHRVGPRTVARLLHERHRPCLRLLALFVYEDVEGLFHYFWHDLKGHFFVRKLTAREVRTLCQLARITPEKLPAKASLEFELRDFQPGERFHTPEGALAEVTLEHPRLIDHLQVELDTPTQRGFLTFLRKDLRVRPADPKLARQLARRARQRALQEAAPFPAGCCHCCRANLDHETRRMRDDV
jgi:hypothetical protein